MTKQIYIKYYTLILIASMQSVLCCSNICWDNWHSKHLIHDFYLEWLHTRKSQEVTQGSWNCGVGGNLPLTKGTVFAVGFDENSIIVKSHPDGSYKIWKRLFVDTNSRGDYSFASPKDTLYIDKKYENDSIYQQNGKWYHTEKNWIGSTDSLFLDKEKTTYFIIDIRNYSDNKIYQGEKTTSYEDESSFIKARLKLGVSRKLNFTIIDRDLQ
jgi:hypothetical protein